MPLLYIDYCPKVSNYLQLFNTHTYDTMGFTMLLCHTTYLLQNSLSKTFPYLSFHPLSPTIFSRYIYSHFRSIETDLSKRKLYQIFSVEELEHMLVPRDHVVECYVLETNGIVTDFCSFYHLPSTVFKCDKHNHLSAGRYIISMASLSEPYLPTSCGNNFTLQCENMFILNEKHP